MTHELGPQCSSDDAFTARMRLHQSWYRAHVLDVPCGVGPGRGSKTSYGNMLRHEDGERGLNFLTPEIAQLARTRQSELPAGIERHRLLCNMLSSQPMCFNLFAPVALDASLGPSLLAALIDEPVDRVVRVIFEHAPAPVAEYLDDGTSFDAFVEYRGPDDTLRFVGIETKLTERFSARRYALDERAGYRRWIRDEGPWRSNRLGDLDSVSHNQLFRDHLLTVAVATRDHETYRTGKLAIVRHRDDTKCERSIASYQACLRPGSWFLDRPLDEIVRRWRPLIGPGWASWLDAFEREARPLAMRIREECSRAQPRVFAAKSRLSRARFDAVRTKLPLARDDGSRAFLARAASLAQHSRRRYERPLVAQVRVAKEKAQSHGNARPAAPDRTSTRNRGW